MTHSLSHAVISLSGVVAYTGALIAGDSAFTRGPATIAIWYGLIVAPVGLVAYVTDVLRSRPRDKTRIGS